MQCYSETITDIFHPYVRASSPSHRVGLVGLFPLPQRQGVSAAKKFILGGWHLYWAYRYQLMQGMSLKLPTTGLAPNLSSQQLQN